MNNNHCIFYREHINSSHYYNEGPGPGSSHGHYDRIRDRPPHLSIDQYSDSSFRSDPDPPPGNYGQDYLTSEDLLSHEGHLGPPLAGRYGGGSGHRRPTIGQAYACQSSPTQPQPPEKKQIFKQSDQVPDQDASVKQGLRSWRINSYLSTYEDSGEDGLTQPMGPDAFEEPLPYQQAAAETSAPRFGIKEPPNVAPKPRAEIQRPRFGKPRLPESTNIHPLPTTNKDLLPSVSDLKPFVLDKKEKEVEKDRQRELEGGAVREMGVDVDVKESRDLFLSKHDSFRSRINPMLQRSSRLRSSLIFSSSKGEIHSGSLGLKPATEADETLDTVRTSSIVAQILEKRRSLSREPFEWRKKTEEKDQERKQQEKEDMERVKEQRQEEREIRLKDEIKVKDEPQTTKEEVATKQTAENFEVKTLSSSINVTDPSMRFQYSKDPTVKRNASTMEVEPSLKVTEPAEKKPDLSDKPPLSITTPKIPTVSVTSSEPEPKKPDISAKLAELNRRPSNSSSKPPVLSAKPSVSHLKPSETSQPHKEENTSEGQKKDLFKSLKPLPSPKLFKRDQLKLKGLNSRRISCGDEILTTEATDAEKSEQKKNRSHSSSTLPRDDFKEGFQKFMGSNTSINTLGEGKGDGKTLDFLKKQTQRLKGFLGPKDKDKKSSGDDKVMSTVIETPQETSKSQSPTKDTGSANIDQAMANHKTSTQTSGPSRYQATGSSVLFSSNLRDDTKVILGQISANSQKNRLEREETGGDKGTDAAEKGTETQNSLKKNRFIRPQGNIQEREGLLKRIESLRKEKKVYSRFEVICQFKGLQHRRERNILKSLKCRLYNKKPDVEFS